MCAKTFDVMAHAQEPDFVFRRNGTSSFKSAGRRQLSRLLAAEVCISAVVMLDTPCSEVVWRVLATHFIRQFPLPFPSSALPCAITFQLVSTVTICKLPASVCVLDCVWNVMAHAQKPDFVFRRNGTCPFKWAGERSVQSTTGSRGVRISVSNAGYTMFWGSVKGTGYLLHLNQ